MAAARLKDNKFIIFNLKSGVPHFIVDGVGVYGLEIINGQFAVKGFEKLIAWSPSIEDPASNTTVASSKREQRPTIGRGGKLRFTSVSPDFHMVACSKTVSGAWGIGSLRVREVASGRFISETPSTPDRPWFSPDPSRIWCGNDREGWKLSIVLSTSFRGPTGKIALAVLSWL